ncbi:MAG: sialidase family protein [Promethearchaeota archaeon]
MIGWILAAISQLFLWGGTFMVVLLISSKRRGYAERVEAIKHNEFTVVYESRDYNAFPKLLKLKDGRLWVCYYQGNDHVDTNNAGKLLHCFSDDNGKSWSTPRVLADHPELDTRNPALGQLADGTLILAFGVYDRHKSSGMQTQWIYSRDDGAGNEWSEPMDIVPEDYGTPAGFTQSWLSPYGNVFEASGGHYAAFYGNNEPRRKNNGESVLLLKLDFSKKKWMFWGDAAKADDTERFRDGRIRGYNEAVIQPAGSKWLCISRSTAPSRHMYLSLSNDLKNWDVPIDTGIRGEAPELIYLGKGKDGILKYFMAYRAENAYTRGGLAVFKMHNNQIRCENRILKAAPGNGGGDSNYVSGVKLDDGTILFVDYHVLKCRKKIQGFITQQVYQPAKANVD